MQVPDLGAMLRDFQARRDALDKFGVYFITDINEEEAERFSKAMIIMGTERKGYPDPRVTLYINSGGGPVGAGFAMMEMMYKAKRDFGIKVNTVITGYAYSMGAVVFQAGDWRSMGYFSTMMLHSTQWIVSGEDSKIFRDYQKLATHYQQIVGELFAKRTGKHNASWWIDFIYSGRDRFLSPQECLELGLADEICTYEACYRTWLDVTEAAAQRQLAKPKQP